MAETPTPTSLADHSKDRRARMIEGALAIVMVGISIGLLAMAGFRSYVESSLQFEQAEPIGGMLPSTVVSNAAQKGASAAKLVLIEFSDFECPFCARSAVEVHPTIDREWVSTGKVRYVFMNLPLEQIHSNAMLAAKSAECARRNGKFWEVHRILFASQTSLSFDLLNRIADQSRLDADTLASCVGDLEIDTFVRQQVKLAREFGLTATPAFVFGTMLQDGSVSVTHKLTGAKPYTVFDSILTRLLSAGR